MWALRILSGGEIGKLFSLQHGVNTIGRSSQSAIQIESAGVSKNHAEINVTEDEIILVDKNSTAGTYVNGIQITRESLEVGDRISFHNIICDIVVEKQAERGAAIPYTGGGGPEAEMKPSSSPPPMEKAASWWNHYLDKVLLPGVYKLPEWMDFRWVIGCFAIAFIFLTMLLSTIPLTRILKASVEKESMNHARSIAEAMAGENRASLIEGLHTALSVRSALRNPGVKEAFIIARDTGRIIAPVEKAQTYPEKPFVHRARVLDKTSVEKLNSSTVAAMVPIQYYNPDTASNATMAYSVVFFNLTSLAQGQSQTLSLIVQSLFIALLIGGLLFFLMYKMILHPFDSMNEQLSLALKDDTVSVSTDYQLTPLQNLCSNINSALERIQSAQIDSSNDGGGGFQGPDRQGEMENLVEMTGFASLCLRLDNSTISALSQNFEEQTGLSSDQILNQPMDQITDTSLQLNLRNVIENITNNPSQIFTDQLDFNGVPFHVTALGILGEGAVSYILVAFIPESPDEEEA